MLLNLPQPSCSKLGRPWSFQPIVVAGQLPHSSQVPGCGSSDATSRRSVLLQNWMFVVLVPLLSLVLLELLLSDWTFLRICSSTRFFMLAFWNHMWLTRFRAAVSRSLLQSRWRDFLSLKFVKFWTPNFATENSCIWSIG